jgi:hypothetical protein
MVKNFAAPAGPERALTGEPLQLLNLSQAVREKTVSLPTVCRILPDAGFLWQI